MKTQSFSVNLANTAPTQKTSPVEIQNEVTPTLKAFTKTVKLHFEEDKKELKDKRKIKTINKYFYTFPNFYKKELRNSFALMIMWFTFFFLLNVATGLGIWQIVISEHVDNWIIAFIAVPYIIITALTIIYIDKYYCFRTEAKTISFKNEKVISLNIQKLYKRLKTAHINVNWMSGLVYVASILVFLLDALFFYLMHKDDGLSNFAKGDYFLQWKYTPDYTFAIISTVSLTCFIGTVLIHASLLVTNYLRVNRIECFYTFMIVSQEDIDLIKKKKNKRDLFIFLSVLFLIFLLGFLIYRLIKRGGGKTTNVVIK